MNYFLYKLKFTTALHVGNDSGHDHLSSSEFTIHSDTLFSALCIEALHYGTTTFNQFIQLFETGQAILSDALPFRGTEFFLPKPIYRKQAVHPLPDPKDRKLFKKLAYIPLSMFYEYLCASDERPFDIHKAVELQKDIVFHDKRECVAISRQEVTRPYFIGSVVFNNECGLYLIIGTESDESKSMLEQLLFSLSYSGIGGKRSVGFGKFELDGPISVSESEGPMLHRLHQLLTNRNADFYMTLNTSLPGEQEMDSALADACFLLCRRGGFVQSYNYAKTPLKKKTIYALSPGACVKRTYSGVLLDLAQGGAHPVYRCLKPLFAGVNL